MGSKSTTSESSIESRVWSYIRSLERGYSVRLTYDRLLIATLREALLENYRVARVVITIKEDKTTTIAPEGEFLLKYDREREVTGEEAG